MFSETFLLNMSLLYLSVTIQTNYFGVSILYATFHYTVFILKTY